MICKHIFYKIFYSLLVPWHTVFYCFLGCKGSSIVFHCLSTVTMSELQHKLCLVFIQAACGQVLLCEQFSIIIFTLIMTTSVLVFYMELSISTLMQMQVRMIELSDIEVLAVITSGKTAPKKRRVKSKKRKRNQRPGSV